MPQLNFPNPFSDFGLGSEQYKSKIRTRCEISFMNYISNEAIKFPMTLSLNIKLALIQNNFVTVHEPPKNVY